MNEQISRVTMDYMYQDARQWLKSAHLTEQAANPSLSNPETQAAYRVWHSMIVISCELFLKYLHSHATGCRAEPIHRLVALWDNLPEVMQKAVDQQFLEDAESGLLQKQTVRALRVSPSPKATSRGFVCSTYRGNLEMLEGMQVDFEDGPARYQYEKWETGDVVLIQSGTFSQVAETLERCATRSRTLWHDHDYGPC